MPYKRRDHTAGLGRDPTPLGVSVASFPQRLEQKLGIIYSLRDGRSVMQCS